jgi:hypothetical protein
MKKVIRKDKIKNTWVVVLGAFFFSGWVLFRVVFPVFHFDYQQEMGGFFSNLIIVDKEYLKIRMPDNYPFSKFSMKLKVNGEKEELFGQVYQDEIGLYPVVRIITDKKELMTYLTIPGNDKVWNGELISKGQAVYFISDGQYRVVLSADIFNRLGFDWDKVKKSNGGEFKSLTKGLNIDKGENYLPGSFLQIDKSLYLVGKNNTLFKIEDQVSREMVRKKFSVVKIDPDKLLSVGEVQCQRRIFGQGIKCVFKANGRKIFPESEIVIEKKEGADIVSGLIKVDTFDKFKGSIIPQVTIRKIKDRIKFNYGEELAKFKL